MRISRYIRREHELYSGVFLHLILHERYVTEDLHVYLPFSTFESFMLFIANQGIIFGGRVLSGKTVSRISISCCFIFFCS